MYTFAKTLEKLRDDNTPYWRLFYYGPGYNNAIQIARNDTSDIEESLKRLEANVTSCTNPEEVRFKIEARPAATSNKGTLFEWDFTINGVFPSQKQQQPQNQFAGFGGFQVPGQMDDFRMEKEKLERKAERLDEEKEHLRKEDTRLQLEKFKLETEVKIFNEQKTATLHELKELEVKYNSSTEAAKNGASLLMAEVLKAFNANSKSKGLAGLFAPEQPPADNVPLSGEDQEIEKIAFSIQGAKLNIEEIRKLGGIVNDLLASIKKQKEEKQKKDIDGVSEQSKTGEPSDG